MEKQIKKEQEDDLRKVPFPNCYTNCGIAEYFGAGECEYFCPSKFRGSEKVED